MGQLIGNSRKPGSFCGRTRREFLWETGAGFTLAALTGLLDKDGFLARQGYCADGITPVAAPLASKPPHFAPRAKSVVVLYMYGGPSHLDTFDYKPRLVGMEGQVVAVRTKGRSGEKNEGRIVEPRWKFSRYSESGQWVSGLFPNLARCVDDIAFVKSMTADSPIHGLAM